MQSADRRLSGEVDLGEDQSGGVGLYMKEEARAFVAVGWATSGSHTGSVVVVATAAAAAAAAVVVMMMIEASHKHPEEYKWDPWTQSGSRWACFRVWATFLAVAGTRHRQSPHGGSYCLGGVSTFWQGRGLSKKRKTNKAQITTRVQQTMDRRKRPTPGPRRR